MFDELEKYKSNGHFFFSEGDDLAKVCNAPKNGIGIYIIYALKGGKIELIFIGSAGKIKQDGTQKALVGGICDQLINGKLFGGSRKLTLKEHIKHKNIDALDIYWYETFDKKNTDIPAFVEGTIMQRYFDLNEQLPEWNEEY